jgi:hypothetical protein
MSRGKKRLGKQQAPFRISHLAALFPIDSEEFPDFPFCESGPLQSLLSEIDYVLLFRPGPASRGGPNDSIKTRSHDERVGYHSRRAFKETPRFRGD